MKNIIKPSFVAERQIPQHIKESYPLFVDFIKAYYKFLDNSQQTLIDQIGNIESEKTIDEYNNPIILQQIRDIDTSLDIFISQFKKEFSENVPIEQANDPKGLIKHLREFYLSRGSEASYKFLFRTLFNKEAEIFYPSKQMLRVSDGKWQQDVSIFVQVTPGFPDLVPLSGNFIVISTTRLNSEGKEITKKVNTFVNRVVEYTSGVFELFIQREFSGEIDIGSVISYQDNDASYMGTVLPCPAKLKVFKPGKGFKVGDLFSLRTETGNGCLIKVTKTGPEGSIQGIDLLQIGLDYQTDFFSYLSNTKIESDQYFHPAKISNNGNFNPGNGGKGHIDYPALGLMDYGYAMKQEYFFYDKDIPVGNRAGSADRYFADTSYVGNLESQFYTEEVDTKIDDNTAIISVKLGAVATYPGYYISQDGFISDEMYIQDGKYYQAYSYVIRVEEELRKYAEIVKKILHPAGMIVYSEYNITTQVRYEILVKSLKRFTEVLDELQTFDQGFGYTKYNVNFTPSVGYEVTPAPDARKVFSAFGKPSLFTLKNTVDTVDVAQKQVKHFAKKASDDSISNIVDTVVKHFYKNLLSDSVVPVDANQKSLSKRVQDFIVTLSEYISKSVNQPKVESITVGDLFLKHFRKNEYETALIISDFRSNIFDKKITELLSLTDAQIKSFTRSLTETLMIVDTISKSTLKTIPVDLVQDVADFYRKSFNKNTFDSITLADRILSKNTEKYITESLLLQDLQAKFLDKIVSSDSITIFDLMFITKLIDFYESVDIQDSKLIFAVEKLITENILIVDAKSLHSNTSKKDAINIESYGAIYINQYDAEEYSAIAEQYTASTPIT